MLKLEVFEAAPADEDPLLDAEAAEKLRESAYEQGYGAGWQDALAQLRDEDALRQSAALEALQAISFTYNEAHATLEASFMSLTRTLLETLVPEVLRLSLPGLVLESLQQAASRDTRVPLHLYCAPQVRATLEQVVAAVPGLEVQLLDEPSYSEAQVSLRLDDQQNNIDLDSVLAQLQAAFSRQLDLKARKGA
ncbi:hypothetical protein [Roseinatronobacter sp. NSM]|uniref:hypothetical protein n=1 Tax=Roseinatronobacter sp. NSM TaxID=3457785 RepID=UPI004036FCBB